MSWSDDIRCLHCDGKLPLYRKITNGQFCSALHRRAYWKEQERLAVERLSQTHDSLRAYHPPAALQAAPRAAILSPIAPETEAIARSASNTDRVKIPGFMPGRRPNVQPMLVDHRVAIEPAPTAWAVSAPPLPLRVIAESSNEMALAVKVDLQLSNWKSLAAPVAVMGGELAPVTAPAPVLTQLSLAAAPRTPELDYQVAMAGKAEIPLADRNNFAAPAALIAGELAPVMEPAPVTTRLSLAAVPQTPEFDAALLQLTAEEQPALDLTVELQMSPSSQTLLALPRIAAHDAEHDEHARMTEALAALDTHLSAQTMNRDVRLDSAVLSAARPQTLSLRAVASAPGQVVDNSQTAVLVMGTGTPTAAALATPYSKRGLLSAPGVQTLALRAATSTPGQVVGNSPTDVLDMGTGTPAAALATPFSQHGLLSAAGLQTMTPGAAVSAGGQTVNNPQAIDLRTEPGTPAVPLATPSSQPRPRLATGSRYAIQQQPPAATLAGQVEPSIEPGLPSAFIPMDLEAGAAIPSAAKILPLTWNATPRVSAARIAVSSEFSALQFEQTKPMEPILRLEPIEGNPEPPSKKNWVSAWMQRSSDPHAKHLWAPAVDFWGHAPRDLKVLVVVIPVLLALALHPSLPKVRVTAPTASRQIQTDFERSFRNQFVNVKQSLADRAGVALSEDFRSGLDDWQLRGQHATAWSFDANGFVRPATLALYRPSMGLGDYEMQFLGLIDKKSLSWVARARDFDNYYVMKLVVLKPGPLPTLGVTRYAVIDGKAQNRVDTLAPVEARPDTLYRVSLDVHGDTYLLSVQGKVVDSWSEPRLTRGGVGFFSPRGEESRLRWVQVTHQYDMLGRLCAYLAPYNIPTTNGSW